MFLKIEIVMSFPKKISLMTSINTLCKHVFHGIYTKVTAKIMTLIFTFGRLQDSIGTIS